MPKGTALRGRRGQTAVLFTMSLPLTFGLVGLVVDVGWMYWRREACQTAAEAAAMAASVSAMASGGSSITCNSGSVWCSTTATACPAQPSASPTNNFGTACYFAYENGFAATGTQNVLVTANSGSAPTVSGVSPSYYVTVRVSEKHPLTFLSVLGLGNWGMASARATSGVISGAAGSCVYVLDPSSAASLSLSNGVTVTSECGYYVDSSNSGALSVVGGAVLKATNSSQIKVVGGETVNNGGSTSPAALLSQSVAADPFLSLPVPWEDSASTRTYSCGYTGCNHTSCDYTNFNWTTWQSGTLTMTPGVYCGGIQIGNTTSVTFSSGVYILNGGGMNLGGSGGISGGVTGSNVLFFNTGTESSYRGITLGNGVDFTFTAPSTGNLQGILFYQDPGITAPTAGASSTTSYFDGGSVLSLGGSLYFPNTTLNFSNGTSTASVSTALVAYDVVFTGGAYFKQGGSSLTGLPSSSAAAYIIE
jgi:Flp pilus assembly protein TadG